MEKLTVWLVLVGAISVGSVDLDFQPEQVHLSVGDNNTDITVTWVTTRPTQTSVVEYSTSKVALSATGSATKFTDGGVLEREMWMHRVTLKKLTADAEYQYRCGSSLGWSKIFSFKTWPSGSQWPLRTAIYGDLGVKHGKSFPRIRGDVARGLYDVVIHVGDFAYDLDSNDAKVGDEFMRMIEPVAASVPYMTCPGNHEWTYDFSNYRARFTMPNFTKTENMFYSWNAGPVHFVSVDTEAYYYRDTDRLAEMWKWLISDLTEAAEPKNRAERPWIVVYGHRPMYCSSIFGMDCENRGCLVRTGIHGKFSMEKLFKDFGIDVGVWGHVHNYERLFPVYDHVVLNGSTDAPYTNPKAPVHFISGSPGCIGERDQFRSERSEWSAFQLAEYSYSRMTVHNATHLRWEQVSDDQDGAIIDSIWVIKKTHRPYPEMYPKYYKTSTGASQQNPPPG